MTRLVPAALTVALAFALTAEARPVRTWSYESLLKEADAVVIATATETKDVGPLKENAKPETWVSVRTTFKPLAVTKGKVADKTFAVDHYRYNDPKANFTVDDGPAFVAFDTSGKTTYLLFLKQEADGRFSPLSRQMDPNASVKVLTDYGR